MILLNKIHTAKRNIDSIIYLMDLLPAQNAEEVWSYHILVVSS